MAMQDNANHIRRCDNIYERLLVVKAVLITVLQQKTSFAKWMYKHYRDISKMDFLSKICSNRTDLTDYIFNQQILMLICLEIDDDKSRKSKLYIHC